VCRVTHSNIGSQVHLVAVQQKDIPTLLPFVQQFYHHFQYPYNEAQKIGALRHLMQDESLGRILLIKHNDRPIGYVLLVFSFSLEFNGSIAFIDELFIEPSGRQKGVGSQVLAQVESLCATLGMKAVRLESEAHNERATALYARSGYHDHKRHLMTKLLKDNGT
jgi:GNAT superfamily N-acetyltransferase